MRPYFLMAVVVTAALLTAPWAARGGVAPSAPPEYADLYPVLEAKLKSVDTYITPRWNGSKHDVAFSAELLAANSNQGEQLLRDEAWKAVTLNLDRMQPLGIRGVKVAVKYPILVRGVSAVAAIPRVL